jgi:LmbE family N-acetylglucosaminyl deacetylase
VSDESTLTRRAAGKRLLVVLAHPDDESLACGGTIARCADAGVEVTLVCATAGDAGSLDPADDTAPGGLADLRATELKEACRVLGVSRVEMLGFEDGMLPWLDPWEILAPLERIAGDVVPDAVISFGRDGLYWHPDHVAIGECTRRLVARAASCAASTLYCATLPPGAMSSIRRAAVVLDPQAEPSFWGIPPDTFAKGAPRPSLEIDVTAQLGRKLEALRCHRSQLHRVNPLRYLDEASVAPLGVEHFHVANSSPGRFSFLDAFGIRRTRRTPES